MSDDDHGEGWRELPYGAALAPPASTVWDSTETGNGRVPIYAKGHDATGWFDLPDQTIVVTN